MLILFVWNPTRRFVLALMYFLIRKGVKRVVNEMKPPMYRGPPSLRGSPAPRRSPFLGSPRSHPGWKLPISKAACGGNKARFSLSDSFRPNGLRSPRRHNKIHSASTLGKKSCLISTPLLKKKMCKSVVHVSRDEGAAGVHHLCVIYPKFIQWMWHSL